MKKYYSLFILMLFSTIGIAQVSNDNCDSAASVTISSSAATTVNFEIASATTTNEAFCTNSANTIADIWYTFTMPVNGNLFIDGAISWNQFEIYEGSDCNSLNQIDCFSTSKLVENLSSGTEYKLRVVRAGTLITNTSFTSFYLRAFEEANNDTCNASTNISVSTTSSNIPFQIGGADINTEVGCNGTTDEYGDIWYDFTMPVNGSLFINGIISWNRFAVYNNDCNSLTEIACFDTSGFATNLTAGTNYKIRLFRAENVLSNTNNAYLNFDIQAFETATNDTCNSSTNISVSTTNTNVTFEIAGADINTEAGCNGTTDEYGDIWYDFTMPVDGNIYIDGIISWNRFALYNNDCNALTEIDCFSKDGLITNLTANTNYKLRLFRAENVMGNTNSTYLNFNIQAFERPVNDTCDASTNINVSNTSTTVNFEIGGANINTEAGCDGAVAQEYGDIWYDFTMPFNGEITINGTISWNKFAIYNSDCNALTEIECIDTNGTVSNLTAGTNYKIRLFRTRNLVGNSTSNYLSFDIQALEIPANDECDNPVMLTLGVELPTNNNGATTSAQVPSCMDIDRQDVWFKVNSGAFSSLNITTNPDGIFQIWEGSCGNLTQLPNGCFSIVGENIAVTPNTDYYLQIWKNDIAISRTTGGFSVLVESAPLSNANNTINGFAMFPNPVDDILTITANERLDSVELYNTIGQQVFKTDNIENNSIDISNLKTGIYIVKIKANNKVVTQKLLKE